MNMHRTDLQGLAHEKRADAELLFQNQRYSNAFYLYGYAVEIALKSKLAKEFPADTIPDKKLVTSIYTHDLNRLLGLADLSTEMDSAPNKLALKANWAIVELWSEESRYDTIDVSKATAMHEAVSDPEHGVFKWIEQHW